MINIFGPVFLNNFDGLFRSSRKISESNSTCLLVEGTAKVEMPHTVHVQRGLYEEP